MARRARPEGARKLSPGFTLGNFPTRISPEGATRYDRESPPNLLIGSRPASGPFRAKRLFPLTEGKPWAKLSCPFGAGPAGLRARCPALNTTAPYSRDHGGSPSE